MAETEPQRQERKENQRIEWGQLEQAGASQRVTLRKMQGLNRNKSLEVLM
jgi:hypothetical protein